MHECPWCGMACDCDGEDTWLDAPLYCQCCPDGDIDEDEESGEDEWDGELVEPRRECYLRAMAGYRRRG